MAVSRLYKSQLRLVFHNGTDPISSKPIFKAKTFTNIKMNATADQLHAVAEAFAGLQKLPLYAVERMDSSEITAE